MPRQSRIDAPGALHHLIIRGIERKAIFKDDADSYGFIERIESTFFGNRYPVKERRFDIADFLP
jgi:hypothetical protein